MGVTIWHRDGTFTEYLDEAEALPKPLRRVRSLAFLDRLPIERQAEIVAAARVLATQGQPLPDLLLTRLGAATELDLDDPRVVHGVAALREAKLIDEAEAAALLADPRPDEAP